LLTKGHHCRQAVESLRPPQGRAPLLPSGRQQNPETHEASQKLDVHVLSVAALITQVQASFLFFEHSRGLAICVPLLAHVGPKLRSVLVDPSSRYQVVHGLCKDADDHWMLHSQIDYGANQ
jgi:hypothetical protein